MRAFIQWLLSRFLSLFSSFRFLVAAYEPAFYWWELVIYFKKFVLTGILAFASPGSTTQLYVAVTVSFFFFAIATRSMPYKAVKTDRVAMSAEANREFGYFLDLYVRASVMGERMLKSIVLQFS